MPHIGFNSLHMFEASACTNVPRGSGCEQLFEAIRKRLFHNTRYAILGGGGVYGVMYIGALMELCGYSRTQYAAWASKLRGVAGTSVGSVIGIMLAAGLDPWGYALHCEAKWPCACDGQRAGYSAGRNAKTMRRWIGCAR